MQFKAATCPSCGGSLQVPDDSVTVQCQYCGVEVIVREAIQAAAVVNIDNWLKIARTAARAGNHQEAYEYFTRVLEVNADNTEAWFGKAEAAGMMSLPEHFRLPEMITNVESAIEHTSTDNKDGSLTRAAKIIHDTTANHYKIIRQKIQAVIANDNAWADYVNQVMSIMRMLDQAHKYDPNNKNVVHGIIVICQENLDRKSYSDPYMRDRKGVPLRRWRVLHQQQLGFLRDKLNHYSVIIRRLDPTYQPPVYQVDQPGIWARTVRAVEGFQSKGFLPSFVSAEALLVISIIAVLFSCGVINGLIGRLRSNRPPSRPTNINRVASSSSNTTNKLSPAEQLSQAKELLRQGATEDDLLQAQNLLQAIPKDAPESKEAQKLLSTIPPRLKKFERERAPASR